MLHRIFQLHDHLQIYPSDGLFEPPDRCNVGRWIRQIRLQRVQADVSGTEVFPLDGLLNPLIRCTMTVHDAALNADVCDIPTCIGAVLSNLLDHRAAFIVGWKER